MCSVQSAHLLKWKRRETEPVLFNTEKCCSEVDYAHLYPSPSTCYGKILPTCNMFVGNKKASLKERSLWVSPMGEFSQNFSMTQTLGK